MRRSAARTLIGALCCLAFSGFAPSVRAEVSIPALSRAESQLRSTMTTDVAGAPVDAIVRLLPGEIAPAHSGVSNVVPGWAVARGTLDELAALAGTRSEWRFAWSPPLRPLLDRAVPETGAPIFRSLTGAAGRGVAIAIVDTGIDVSHPDFRRADGTTRIAWLLDFSRSPRGVHPDVEGQCASRADDADQCSVPTAEEIAACEIPFAAYSADEIDQELMRGTFAALPGDPVGHGTHVASLAASNGLSDDPPRYAGMAPEADLLIARASTDPSDPFAFTDPSVLKAVQVLFWLAEDRRECQGLAAQPAVVNLSLGSDAGPHDDRSSFAKALSEMVGPDFPGRAIVTAAGNSASLFTGLSDYPQPLGIHTEVDVPEGSTVRVPILMPHPSSGASETRATVYVWADFREGDDVSVGFEDSSGAWIDPVPPGYETARKQEGVEVKIFNGQEKGLGPEFERSAAVELSGTWKSGKVFALRLRGRGTANLWLQSQGDLGPEMGSIGALFPASTKEATVSIPAAHPELIAVGATTNRNTWTNRIGEEVDVGALIGTEPEIAAVTNFSSAGPSSLGNIKPEIVAPGGFVIGAMGVEADPLENPNSVFALGGCDPPEHCFVVDDRHAVSAGTSMAAPVVTGAIALLLEHDPMLTQQDIRSLLQASAAETNARLEQQAGAGALDMERLFDALDVRQSGVIREPSPRASRIISGSSYARPDGEWTVRLLVQLRDSEGRIADGFDANKLRLVAKPAVVVRPLQRVAPGLWRFAVAAPKKTGGEEMAIEVRYDGTLLATKRLPIAMDVSVMRHGFSAEGGCSVSDRTPRGSATVWLAAAIAALLTRRRYRR